MNYKKDCINVKYLGVFKFYSEYKSWTIYRVKRKFANILYIHRNTLSVIKKFVSETHASLKYIMWTLQL